MKQDLLQSKVVKEDMNNIFERDIPWNDMTGSTILITGATGMLASYIIFFLIWLNEKKNKGIHIIALVRNRKKCLDIFGTYARKEYFSICTNPLDRAIGITGNVDYVIHAASLASPQFYGPNPVEVALPNAIGTYHILELARQKKSKGVLYFSTGDVYGLIDDKIGLVDEEVVGRINQLDVHSCYGESKRMGETWCASFMREFDVPAKIARIWHTYGPTMDIKEDPRVFSSFMSCICDGKDIVMLSDGTAKRSFCYLADAISGYFTILLKGKSGEAYNVCNEQEFLSIAELAETLIKIVPEKKIRVIKKQRKETENYIENTCNKCNKASSEKLKELGWTCKYNVLKGFTNVYNYIVE